MLAPTIASELRTSAALFAQLFGPANSDRQGDVSELRTFALRRISGFRALVANTLEKGVAVDHHGEGETPQYLAAMTSLLSDVRQARAVLESEADERFALLLDQYAGDLASEYRQLRRSVIGYTHEAERTLIFFGAGDDSDAELVRDLIPDID